MNQRNNGLPKEIEQHRKYMLQAFKLAEEAYDEDEVPVGALVVKDNRIIGKGYNQTERLKDATAHAEMLAISAACSTIESKYLEGCTIYVTLEPCPMCTGALVWSKIDRIVFGTQDPNAGACGSMFNLSGSDKLNHKIEVIQGVMEDDCKWILQQFFRDKRSESDNRF